MFTQSDDQLNLRHPHIPGRQGLLELELHEQRDVNHQSLHGARFLDRLHNLKHGTGDRIHNLLMDLRHCSWCVCVMLCVLCVVVVLLLMILLCVGVVVDDVVVVCDVFCVLGDFGVLGVSLCFVVLCFVVFCFVVCCCVAGAWLAMEYVWWSKQHQQQQPSGTAAQSAQQRVAQHVCRAEEQLDEYRGQGEYSYPKDTNHVRLPITQWEERGNHCDGKGGGTGKAGVDSRTKGAGQWSCRGQSWRRERARNQRSLASG